MILTELCQSSKGLGELLQDQYGNYVVQQALSVATEQPFMMLINAIRSQLPALEHTKQGQRLVKKLTKKYPDLETPSAKGNSGVGGLRGGMVQGAQTQAEGLSHALPALLSA